MKQKIRLIPSGIPLIDTAWGGLYKGGSYILIGPRKTGKTLLALQFTREAVKQKEVCLFFTTLRPKDLMIHAASIQFDLQHYMNQNNVILIKVASPVEINETVSDETLSDYLDDIVALVEQYQPDKIVFDELTDFVGFSNLRTLGNCFRKMTDNIEESGITTLYILGDPATPAAQKIVDVISSNSTGLITLEKNFQNDNNDKGKIIIVPNIGHTEGKFEAVYKIEPHKGVIVLKPSDQLIEPDKEKAELKYKPLSDLEIPEEKLSFSNFYTISDFQLILNTQIALFKSTGQGFSVVSFRFDKEAENSGLISFNQFKDVMRLSIDRKDKFCIVDNKILVLIIKENHKDILSLVAKVKNNLPVKSQTDLKKILQYLSVYAVHADNKIENSEYIFNELLSEEVIEKKNIRII